MTSRSYERMPTDHAHPIWHDTSLTDHARYPALYCDPILRFRMTIVKRTFAPYPAINSSVNRRASLSVICCGGVFMK